MSARPFVSFLVLAGLACGESAAATDDVVKTEPVVKSGTAEPAPAKAPAKETTGGAITGKITFSGSAPEAEPVDLSPDPFCADHHGDGLTQATVNVGAGGGLADVFVQITNAPDEKYETPETPVELDQRGCTYYPHVFGMMKRQDLVIINSDATLHNIHPTPKDQKEFNLGMPNEGMRVTKTFKKAEEAIKVKCDVHPWMSAYCFVMEHPFYAVSARDGSFSLPTDGLPDGDYQVKVWHETLGEATGSVTVADGSGTFEHAFGR